MLFSHTTHKMGINCFIQRAIFPIPFVIAWPVILCIFFYFFFISFLWFTCVGNVERNVFYRMLCICIRLMRQCNWATEGKLYEPSIQNKHTRAERFSRTGFFFLFLRKCNNILHLLRVCSFDFLFLKFSFKSTQIHEYYSTVREDK